MPWAQALPGDRETELVQAAERSKVRAGEGSVGHVEAFRMGGVGTLIIGRPRPLSPDRRADPLADPLYVKSQDIVNPLYTLNCEEPENGV